MSKKRPAASLESLKRENAKLKKENAALGGEDNAKAPVANSADEAYVTGLLAGREVGLVYQMEGFDEQRASGLYASLHESIRDGRDIELSLKGGKKVDLKKTFKQNGIKPNSFVYIKYK